MRIQITHAAALALAGALAIAATTPSFAKSHPAARAEAVQHPIASQDDGFGNIVNRHFAPGSTGYGRWAYNPEQPTDPDPRICGALKMSTDR